MKKVLTTILLLMVSLGAGWFYYSTYQMKTRQRLLPLEQIFQRIEYFVASPPAAFVPLAIKAGEELEFYAGKCVPGKVLLGLEDLRRPQPPSQDTFNFYKPFLIIRGAQQLGELSCWQKDHGLPFFIKSVLDGAVIGLERRPNSPMRFKLMEGTVSISSPGLHIELLSPGLRTELKSSDQVSLLFSAEKSRMDLVIFSGRLQLALLESNQRDEITLPIRISTEKHSELWSDGEIQAKNGESIMLLPSGLTGRAATELPTSEPSSNQSL